MENTKARISKSRRRMGIKQKRVPLSQPNNPLLGLNIFEGEWTYETAAHLLRRTTFGPTPDQIKESVELGLEGTLTLLFEELPMPDPPVNYYFEDDPAVPIGEPWLNAIHQKNSNVRRHRFKSLNAWIFKNILEERTSIREKLTLFWHNHFAVSNVGDPTFLYNYFDTLRTNAWGNFKDLVKKVTLDPAMLRFLNGNQNTERAPNENFARELLELYTVGKGPSAGPGDYTTFTELDVVEIAKVLTGWRDQGYQRKEEIEVTSFFYNGKA